MEKLFLRLFANARKLSGGFVFCLDNSRISSGRFCEFFRRFGVVV